MFFTLRSLDGIIFDIDRLPLQMVADLTVAFAPSKRVIYVSRNMAAVSPNAHIPVVVPLSWAEIGMFQSVLRRAIQSLNLNVSACVIVSGNSETIAAGKRLLLGTVAVLPQDAHAQLPFFESFADITAFQTLDVVSALTGHHAGYTGELRAMMPNHLPFFSQTVSGKYARTEKIPNITHADCPIEVSGRYFDVRDIRHSIHPLSLRITHSKKPESGLAQTACMSDIADFYFTKILNGNFDLITRIPPRPSASSDRLLALLQPLAQKYLVDGTALTCVRDYPKLSTTSSAAERKTAVAGAFAASPAVFGKRVCIFDDVVTTTNTMNECISMLKQLGAEAIFPFAIGYHPFRPREEVITSKLNCVCGAEMEPRHNGTTGDVFYGCKNYFNMGNRCTRKKTFLEGSETLLSRIHAQTMLPEAELGSQDFPF